DLLFHTLEGLANQTPEPSQWEPSGPFMVHRRHLTLLVKALDEMAYMGFPHFMPVDLHNRGINGRRSPKDYP
ncbi:hypothetical protein C8A00DRAFT_35241, partial [Chaetomidium leptoderma]